eukprot:749176-Hanusia_phi.AAC.2
MNSEATPKKDAGEGKVHSQQVIVPETPDPSPAKQEVEVLSSQPTKRSVARVDDGSESDSDGATVLRKRHKGCWKRKIVDSSDEEEGLNDGARGSNGLQKNHSNGIEVLDTPIKPIEISEDDDNVETVQDSEDGGTGPEEEDDDEEVARVDDLLQKVEEIGKNLSCILADLVDTQNDSHSSRIAQPRCLGAQSSLQLKPYQLVGLNWWIVVIVIYLRADCTAGYECFTHQKCADMPSQRRRHIWASYHRLPCKCCVKLEQRIQSVASVGEKLIQEHGHELSNFPRIKLRVVVYHGSQKERAQIRTEMYDASTWSTSFCRKVLLTISRDVVLTTYTCFERESGKQDRAFLRS